jgi:hypothetical protein
MDWLPLAFDCSARAPMVTTIHGFSGPGILPAYVRSRSSFVAISESDRSPDLDYVATIHHVVAYRRGSMTEVIDESVTGYLADDVTSAIRGVDAAARLDRRRVASRARERFSAARMVSDYLRVYEQLLSG